MSDVELALTPQIEARLLGTPLVIMLDVDGTLAPIVSRPEDAAVAPATRSDELGNQSASIWARASPMSDIHPGANCVVLLTGRSGS